MSTFKSCMTVDDLRGSWAVVTGASAGIGYAFATELARAGVNLVLIARRAERLNELSRNLESEFGVTCLPMIQDLTEPDAAEKVASAVSSHGIRLRLLCNNAAFGKWGRFDGHDPRTYVDMLHLNTTAAVELSLRLLPELRANAPSAIINVSSPAAYQPVPFMAVYAASKACLHQFSLALYEELRTEGVFVQTLVPGPTATEFDKVAQAYESKLTKRDKASDVAAFALRHLETGEPLATFAHGTFQQRIFSALAPSRLMLRTVGKMFRPKDS